MAHMEKEMHRPGGIVYGIKEKTGLLVKTESTQKNVPQKGKQTD